jgi:hypothetical protein
MVDYEPTNSPRWMGDDRFTVSIQSLNMLLGDSDIITYNLLFNDDYERLPTFGFSSMSFKKLFCKVDYEEALETNKDIIIHKWDPQFDAAWNEFNIAKGEVLEICFQRVERGTIDFRVSLNGQRSATYTYDLAPLERDLYFALFVPYDDFKERRIQLLSTLDYALYALTLENEPRNGRLRSPRSEGSVLCSICLDEGHDESPFKVLSCGHRFHSHCIHQWIKGDKPTCPECREPVRNA